jgi:tetratricopeptide (TPR) repeat protein
MRRTQCALTAILGVVILFCGCTDNTAVRLRYQAEKQFYHAEKAAQAASFRGESVDPAVARNIRDQFGDVANLCLANLDIVTREKYPQENRQLSAIAYQSTTRLAQMYLAVRRFDTLAVLISQLLDRATLSRSELATTYYNYGRALQLGGKWDSSLVTYSTALAKFRPPVDDSGHVLFLVFNLPLRIHKAFRGSRDEAGRADWFMRAEAYYREWSKSTAHPTELSMTSLGNLGRLYEDAEMWDRAAATLLTMQDSTGATAAAPKLHVADLYVERLNRPDDAIAIYRELDGMLVGRDTLSRPALLQKQALACMNKKDYTQAREILTDIGKRWPAFFAVSSAAQYNKARCFEMENNWNRAETEYRFLIDHYPTSEEALSTYLYLAQKATDGGRSLEADQWYERAEKTYSSLVAKNPGSTLEAMALYFKADMHRQKKNWPAAAEALVSVFSRFPLTEPGQRAAVMAAEVYRDKLNDNRKADSLIIALQEVTVAESGPEGQ